MSSRLTLLLLSLVGAACSSVAPLPRPRGDVPAAAASPRDSLRGPWLLRNVGHPRSAVIELRAELVSTIDTITRRDSVASQTLLDWSATSDANGTRLLGMVREFSLRAAGDSAWQAIPGLLLPVTFTAAVDRRDAQPQFVQPDASGCDARAAVVQALRETWVAPPERLDVGVRWQDSSVYPLCRDGLVLETTSVRTYVVEAAELLDDRLVLRVQRRSHSRISGRGLQFGDSVSVRGEGRGDATLFLSPDAAVVLRAEGESRLELELQGRRRTQQLVQTGALSLRTP